MPEYTGRAIATAALREIGVLDPIEAAHAEQTEDALAVGTDLLDSWRTDRLTIGGFAIPTYSLVANTQSYTIGEGGDFNQAWPEFIAKWSVVPDDDAADPLELPMGRPLTYAEWQQVRIKSQTSSRPNAMYYDEAYAAGLGNVSFHPIPDNADVDVKLYCKVPVITSLVAATTYDLRPGYIRALKLGLAVELADRYGKTGPRIDRIERRATQALGQLRRSNIRLVESPIRSEFAIGRGGRRGGFNIYTGGR